MTAKCQHEKTHSSFGSGGAWTSIETVTCTECGKVIAKYEVTGGARIKELPINEKGEES